ncbi:MAG: MlaE family lipid ABC transporter permease subunit [Desulfobacteraceae bacterium]|nr:MAG: MlaE family lipid ABC transporter permease subunit [Desulfobacteraceae bacterium]
MVLHFWGRMDAERSPVLLRELDSFFAKAVPRSLAVELSKVVFLDDFGALVLVELKRLMMRSDGLFRLENPNAEVQEVLKTFQFDSLGKEASLPRKQKPGLLVRLGDSAIAHVEDFRYLISFIGAIALSLLYVCRHPRSLRTEDTFSCMQRTGVDALPIVCLISFLLGLIMAFMSSVQLKQFGANIYVASLVSLSMVRELGPIMTAIIVAGRSGSSFAAEIGTMKISEEVDALYTMGFDPTRFLVIPKLIASVVVVPMLTLFSDVFAILGGLLVGVTMLDLTTSSYMSQTMKTLSSFDISLGLVKSAVFAMLIAWIGCLRGFQVRGGAASVGQATTSAVVSSIFLIILTDSVFSVLLRYW